METIMKKKKGILVITLIVVGSLFFFTACKPHSTKSAFMLDYVSESLDLTTEQEKMLGDIKDEICEKMKELRGGKDDFHALLKEQLAGDKLDKEFIQQAIMEHRTKKDIIIDLAVDKLIDFHAQLTPDQRAKLV
jgi:periplasmic protein CpxP/Spy